MNELRNDERPTAPTFVNSPRPGAVSISEPDMSEPDLGDEAESFSTHRATTPIRLPDACNTPPDLDAEARRTRSITIEGGRPPANVLFPQDELESFRSHWDEVQTSFVDAPRKAVELADSLVDDVVKRIVDQFAAEREELEKQWDSGENVDTEDLRQAFKSYRAFFDRLLMI